MDSQFRHLLAWLAALLGVGIVYTLGIVVYRLFFHPLAKYPGPFLAKITGLYELYHATIGDRHLEFYRMHERYGPIVRYGPNGLSFNSNVALKDIYGFKANVGKAAFYDAFAHPAANTHNSRDKKEHARKRRVLSHAFSDGAIKEAERYILKNVRTFCDVIGQRAAISEKEKGEKGEKSEKRTGWTGPQNIGDLCNWLAMDILGDLCFGKAFHMLDKTDNRYAVSLVGYASKRHLLCGTYLIIDKLGLDKIFFRKIAAGRARYVKHSGAQLTERMKLGDNAERRDFFHYLLQARDPETGEGFTKPELWGEANLLIIAGSDTTSTSMAGTLFYLVRHRAALDRATKEVRTAFATADDIAPGPVLMGCNYLRACIDEAMRMSPAVGGLLPRQVLAGGYRIAGEMIPEGIDVGTPHYTVQHNADYYPQPFDYIPERWIAGEKVPFTTTSGNGTVVTEDDVARAQSAFCPFSLGPRGCIGKGLAYTEMMTTLARLLYMFDVRKTEGIVDPAEGRTDAEYGRHRPGEFQLQDVFTSIKEGPMIDFRPRV